MWSINRLLWGAYKHRNQHAHRKFDAMRAARPARPKRYWLVTLWIACIALSVCDVCGGVCRPRTVSGRTLEACSVCSNGHNVELQRPGDSVVHWTTSSSNAQRVLWWSPREKIEGFLLFLHLQSSTYPYTTITTSNHTLQHDASVTWRLVVHTYGEMDCRSISIQLYTRGIGWFL